jgi:hypothetical protein
MKLFDTILRSGAATLFVIAGFVAIAIFASAYVEWSVIARGFGL